MTDSTTQSATAQASDKVQEATGKVQEAGREASQQARTRVTDMVDQRSTDAGQQVSSTADALRQTSSQLREKGNDAPAKVVEAVAQQIEGVGSWLRDSDGDQILHDIENFGRRQPTAIMFGGIALGFAASRLLRASSSRRFETRTSAAPDRQVTGGAARRGYGASTVDPGREGLLPTPTPGETATTTPPSTRPGDRLGPGMGNVGGEAEGFTPPRGA